MLHILPEQLLAQSVVEWNEKELFHSINYHVIYFPIICTLNLLLPDF